MFFIVLFKSITSINFILMLIALFFFFFCISNVISPNTLFDKMVISAIPQQQSRNLYYNNKALEMDIVNRLYYGYGDEKDLYIYFLYYENCGFANNFRTLVGSAILALVSGRRLRSIFCFIIIIQ